MRLAARTALEDALAYLVMSAAAGPDARAERARAANILNGLRMGEAPLIVIKSSVWRNVQGLTRVPR